MFGLRGRHLCAQTTFRLEAVGRTDLFRCWLLESAMPRPKLMPRNGRPTPNPAFTVQFKISNHTYSGLRVDQLKVHGDVGYKPFKGVRTSSRAGRVDVRW